MVEQNSNQDSGRENVKDTSKGCTCELVVKDGGWELRPESSSDCVQTVEALNESLGPNAKAYLSTHIVPQSPEINEAVQKLKNANKSD